MSRSRNLAPATAARLGRAARIRRDRRARRGTNPEADLPPPVPSLHHQQRCFNITTGFSHSQTVVLCGSCSAVLCQPTGGKARLTEGCSFRRKGD